jgi:hypothetical protein
MPLHRHDVTSILSRDFPCPVLPVRVVLKGIGLVPAALPPKAFCSGENRKEVKSKARNNRTKATALPRDSFKPSKFHKRFAR